MVSGLPDDLRDRPDLETPMFRLPEPYWVSSDAFDGEGSSSPRFLRLSTAIILIGIGAGPNAGCRAARTGRHEQCGILNLTVTKTRRGCCGKRTILAARTAGTSADRVHYHAPVLPRYSSMHSPEQK